jgi:hypothetical protein
MARMAVRLGTLLVFAMLGLPALVQCEANESQLGA